MRTHGRRDAARTRTGWRHGGRAPVDDVVDWELAAVAGRSGRAPAPQVARDEAAAVVAELRRLAAERPRTSQGFTGLTARRGPADAWWSTGAGWVEVNIDGFAADARAAAGQGRRRAATAGAPGAGRGRLPGHRASRSAPCWPTRRRGAGPVRAVLPSAGPTASGTGCCWSRRTSSRWSASSASTRPTSGLGLPARGDPPGPVHRRAVAARRTLVERIRKFLMATDLDPPRSPTGSATCCATRRDVAPRQGRASPHRPGADPGAAGDRSTGSPR